MMDKQKLVEKVDWICNERGDFNHCEDEESKQIERQFFREIIKDMRATDLYGYYLEVMEELNKI